MSDNAKDQSEDGEKQKLTFGQKVKKELREWGVTLSVFVPLFLLFSGLVYELRVIPSESMVPNLQVGDRVTVNKFAYGYSRHSLPFSLGRYVPLPEGRIFAGNPKRGDVVVFEHPHTPRVMIKRLIGLPGDRIQVRGNRIFLNGEPIDRERQRTVRYDEYKDRSRVTAVEYKETIGDKSWIAHDMQRQGNDSSPIFVVPEGHFLFFGDNRDNSLDGRSERGHCRQDASGAISQAGCEPRIDPFTNMPIPGENASIGFVPFDNLIGRADTVLFSTYSCGRVNAEPCMKKRVWRPL